jgi:hypothetical protein
VNEKYFRFPKTTIIGPRTKDTKYPHKRVFATHFFATGIFFLAIYLRYVIVGAPKEEEKSAGPKNCYHWSDERYTTSSQKALPRTFAAGIFLRSIYSRYVIVGVPKKKAQYSILVF